MAGIKIVGRWQAGRVEPGSRVSSLVFAESPSESATAGVQAVGLAGCRVDVGIAWDTAPILIGAGIDYVVAAPSKLQRPSPDRVKSDMHDARHLARLPHLGDSSAPSSAARAVA